MHPPSLSPFDVVITPPCISARLERVFGAAGKRMQQSQVINLAPPKSSRKWSVNRAAWMDMALDPSSAKWISSSLNFQESAAHPRCALCWEKVIETVGTTFEEGKDGTLNWILTASRRLASALPLSDAQEKSLDKIPLF